MSAEIRKVHALLEWLQAHPDEKLSHAIAEHGITDRDLRDVLFGAEEYNAVCERLRVCVERNRLGLGGERVDMLVCDEIDRLYSLIATMPMLLRSGEASQYSAGWNSAVRRILAVLHDEDDDARQALDAHVGTPSPSTRPADPPDARALSLSPEDADALRELLIAADSVCSLVAHRFVNATIPDDVRGELLSVSGRARSLYDGTARTVEHDGTFAAFVRKLLARPSIGSQNEHEFYPGRVGE